MTETAGRTVERQFIIDRQGKPFVLMAGLLDLAHQDGVDLIETTQTQVATDENNLIHIFRAIVHTKRGTFTGHGSAGPANVSRMMLTHTLELAETRAIGRALRFATNIAMTTLEELGDDVIAAEPEARPSFTPEPPAARPQPTTPIRPPTPTVAPGPQDAATPAQIRAIYAIGKDFHHFNEEQIAEQTTAVFGVRPSELTRRQASEFITNMKGNGR